MIVPQTEELRRTCDPVDIPTPMFDAALRILRAKERKLDFGNGVTACLDLCIQPPRGEEIHVFHVSWMDRMTSIVGIGLPQEIREVWECYGGPENDVDEWLIGRSEDVMEFVTLLAEAREETTKRFVERLPAALQEQEIEAALL